MRFALAVSTSPLRARRPLSLGTIRMALTWSSRSVPPAVGGSMDADSDEAYEYLYGPVRQRRFLPDRAVVSAPHDRPFRPASPAAHRWVADPSQREQHGWRERELRPAP